MYITIGVLKWCQSLRPSTRQGKYMWWLLFPCSLELAVLKSPIPYFAACQITPGEHVFQKMSKISDILPGSSPPLSSLSHGQF